MPVDAKCGCGAERRSDQAELVEQGEVVADDPALDDPPLVVEAAERHRVPGEHPARGRAPRSCVPWCVPV